MASSSGTKDDMGPPRTLSKRLTRSLTVGDPSDENSAVDSELVPSSLAFIAPILRVANEIEKDNPRVAYLCKTLNWTKWRSSIIFDHGCKFVCVCCYSLWFMCVWFVVGVSWISIGDFKLIWIFGGNIDYSEIVLLFSEFYVSYVCVELS